ncbi:MAG TPA: LLM class flavin-dependent oxidoreductase [Thermoleophilaceae bacterium]|nr:LLM class flavin-dependent oxidoreductase [Thermoleophilaceae bacterium]
MGLGSFISVGRSLETALQRVELAERLGYESVYVTHIAALDSLTALMAYAARSSTIRLGTGVLPIYSRTPVASAQSFATLDEFSGGRAVIGLGVSHRPVVEGWYGDAIGKPVSEMREYVGIVRAILRGEDPPQGERFRSGFHFMGYEPRPDLPIYVAGLSPGMLRLAGEVGDGVVLWLCNPEYVREVVVPAVREGREKAGKGLDGFDIVAAVPAAVTGEPDEVRGRLRSELIPYFSLPFYRKMIERSGYEQDVRAFDEGMEGGGPEAAIAGISDRFLGSLAAIGTPDQALAAVRRYREAGATSPCVGAIAKTDFDATLEALAGSLA